MVQIIQFPSARIQRKARIERFAAKLEAHMHELFRLRGVTCVPVGEIISEMALIMIDDGFEYDHNVLDHMCEDPIMLMRMEQVILNKLVTIGVLDQNFR